jgi:hypothetical protein
MPHFRAAKATVHPKATGKQVMKRSIGSLKALLIAVLLAVPMGCRPDVASGPDQTLQPPLQPQASLLGGVVGGVTGVVGGVVGVVVDVANALLSPLVCPTDDSYTASRTIGRNGGTLKVGPHTLTIPSGALAQDTRITATAPSGSYAEVRFKPHGLTFKRDVTLSVSYAKCGLLQKNNPPVIVYADDDRNILEILKSTIDTRQKTVTGKTDHFSSYILAER